MWDTEENVQQVHRTVDYLTQGCKCKTGCGTQRCKCMKGSLKCGPSCQCVNYRNTTKYTAQNNDREEELLEEIYAEAQLQQDGDDVESEDRNIRSDREGYSTDEENRLEALNQEVDQLMEDHLRCVWGILLISFIYIAIIFHPPSFTMYVCTTPTFILVP